MHRSDAMQYGVVHNPLHNIRQNVIHQANRILPVNDPGEQHVDFQYNYIPR